MCPQDHGFDLAGLNPLGTQGELNGTVLRLGTPDLDRGAVAADIDKLGRLKPFPSSVVPTNDGSFFPGWKSHQASSLPW